MFKFYTLCLVLALFTLSLATLKIYGPNDLKNHFSEVNNNIFYGIARFGYIPHGKKLMGRVYLSDPVTACQSLNTSHIHFDATSNENDPRNSPILLVERGSCSFTTKTRHAQLIGAKMVIVIDNDDENTDSVILADDGKGSSITIPTIMIAKKHGKIFKDYLSNHPDQHVQIAITFPMNLTRDVISVDYWYSSSDKHAYEFVANMANYIWGFGQQVVFTPHFVTWYSAQSRAENWTGTNPEHCLANGRYCAPDPDGDGPLSGQWVINEDLHQLCIYKNWGFDGYLNYMMRVNSECFQNPAAHLDLCPEIVLRDYFAQFNDFAKYEACFLESAKWGNIKTDDNILLAKEREFFTNSEITYWPMVLIDHTPYKGKLTPVEDVAEAICQKMNENSKADLCIDVEKTLQTSQIVESDFNSGMVVGFCALFIAIFVVILYWYRRILRKDLSKDMSLQLHHMISDYAAFKDTNKLIRQNDTSNL
jgi:hypothetical protein